MSYTIGLKILHWLNFNKTNVSFLERLICFTLSITSKRFYIIVTIFFK